MRSSYNSISDEWIDVDLDFDDDAEPYLGEIEEISFENSALKLLHFTKDLHQLQFSFNDLKEIRESCEEHPSLIIKKYTSSFPKPYKI